MEVCLASDDATEKPVVVEEVSCRIRPGA